MSILIPANCIRQISVDPGSEINTTIIDFVEARPGVDDQDKGPRILYVESCYCLTLTENGLKIEM